MGFLAILFKTVIPCLLGVLPLSLRFRALLLPHAPQWVHHKQQLFVLSLLPLMVCLLIWAVCIAFWIDCATPLKLKLRWVLFLVILRQRMHCLRMTQHRTQCSFNCNGVAQSINSAMHTAKINKHTIRGRRDNANSFCLWCTHCGVWGSSKARHLTERCRGLADKE